MPSFDVTNKIDHQTLDNVINVVIKEIVNRYDFHDSKTEISLDKKALNVHVVTENDMRIKAIETVLMNRSVKQHLDPRCFDFGKEHYAAGNMVKKDIKVKEGIEKDTAKKIVKDIKECGLKVQASIMDDMVRVTGKKIDDLQSVISLLKTKDYGIPLQFVNMKG